MYEDPFDPGWGPKVGYRFARPARGRGCATELVRFCLASSRQRVGWSEVRAFAHLGNRASRRVLAEAGSERRRFAPGMARDLHACRPS